jgi:mannose-1-phosphate guanylyltransferase
VRRPERYHHELKSQLAVVLTDGDGARFQSLILKISGDSPKQFCSIFGGKSLLSQTWQRLGALISE